MEVFLAIWKEVKRNVGRKRERESGTGEKVGRRKTESLDETFSIKLDGFRGFTFQNANYLFSSIEKKNGLLFAKKPHFNISAPGLKQSIFFSEGSYEESRKKWFTTFL